MLSEILSDGLRQMVLPSKCLAYSIGVDERARRRLYDVPIYGVVVAPLDIWRLRRRRGLALKVGKNSSEGGEHTRNGIGRAFRIANDREGCHAVS
jgi:hypothetical protein